MATINFREGTAAEWTTENPTLIDGEPGFESDTGKFKIGRGGLAWVDLPYFATVTAGGGGGGDQVYVGPAAPDPATYKIWVEVS